MPTIDESVVKLSLDDSQFNRASDKTITKLDELKRSLQFDGAVEGFEEIEKAAKKTNLSPIEKSVEAVSLQFDALYAIADTTFRRIINGAVDSGERLIKSLTVDNISAGWGKYAKKTSAVQTIMAATAKEFDDTAVQMEYVEDQLEKLNWFTDETSYAFLDMVNNIGKFTSNQIALDDAVTAMQGISNWAAISGAGIQGASRAMYNLAQAIGVGSVKLIDWKSIENANMATAEFKEMALQAAAARGEIIDLGDGIYKTLKGQEVTIQTFSQNLSEGWFTSDVLMDTLSMYGSFADELYKFSEAADGLSATPLIRYINEYRKGTLDLKEALIATGMEADELIDWLERLGSKEYDLGRRAFAAAQEAKTFQEAIDATKEAVASGWMQSFEYIFGNYEEAKELWSDLAEGLYEVFVESGNMRNGLLRDWKALNGRTYLIDGLKTLLSNLANAITFVKDTFESVFPPKTAEELVNMTDGFKNLMELMVPSENTIQAIQNVLTLLFTIMKKIGQVAVVVIAGLEPIWELLGQISAAIVGLIGDIAALIGLNVEEIFSADNLTALYKIIHSISTVISNIARVGLLGIIGVVANIISFVQDIWATFKAGEGGIKGFIDAVIVNFKRLFNTISSWNLFENIYSNISNFISGGLVGVIYSAIQGIKTLINFLTNGLTSNILSSFQGITSLFDKIKSGESIFSKFFKGVFDIAKTVFGGISDLVQKIFESFNEGNIDSNPIVTFFNSVGEAISNSGLINNIKGATNTILNFISSMFGFISDFDNISENLKVMVGSVSEQISILWNWFVGELTELSLRDVADVLLILVIADLISSCSLLTNSLSKVNAALTKTLGSITTFFNTISGSQNAVTATITALSNLASNTKYLQIGISIVMIANSLMDLASIDTDRLGLAISSLITVIGLMVILEKALGNTIIRSGHGNIETAASNIFKLAASVAILSAGLTLLSSAITNGFYEKTENGKEFTVSAMNAQILGLIAAITSIGVLMLELAGLVAIIKAIGPGDEFAKAAVGMTGLATGVLVLSAAVTILSLLPIQNLIQGAAAVSILTLALGLAGAALGSVNVASVLSGAAAATMFALALGELTIPLVILGGLSEKYDLNELRQNLELLMLCLTLAIVGIESFGSNAAVVLTASAAMVAFAGSVTILAAAMHLFNGMDPKAFSMGITTILVSFVGFAVVAAIAQASALGLLALAAVFISFASAVALLAATIKLLSQAALQFAAISLAFVAAGEQIGEDFPAKLEEAFSIVEASIRAFLKMLVNLSGDIAATAVMLILALKNGFILALPDIITGLLIIGTAICDAIVKFAPGFIDAVAEMILALIPGIPKLLNAFGLFIEELFAGFGDIVFHAIIGLFRGILGMFGLYDLGKELSESMEGVGKATVDGFKNGLDTSEGRSAGEEFGNAVGTGISTALGVNSPSEFADEVGGYTTDGLVNGLERGQHRAYDAGKSLGDAAIEGMRDGAGTHSDSVFAIDIANYISSGFNNTLTNLFPTFEDTGLGNASSYFGGFLNGLKEGGKNTESFLDSFLQMFNYKTGLIDDKLAAERMSEESKLKAQIKEGKKLGYDVSDLEKQLSEISKTSAKTSKTVAASSSSIADSMGSTAKSVSSGSKSSGKIQTAAEKIIESYKTVLEELEYLDKKHKAEYNLWEALNPNVTELEKNTVKLDLINKDIETQLRRTEISKEKYEKIAKAMGSSSQEARDAEIEWMETQVSLAQLQNESLEIQNEIIANASKQLELDEKNAELSYNLWVSSSKEAAQLEQEKKKLAYTTKKLEYSQNKVNEAEKTYNESLEKYGKESVETKQALRELLQAQKDYADISSEVDEIQKSIADVGKKQAELAYDNMSLEYDIWVSSNKKASQVEQVEKKLAYTMSKLERAQVKVTDATTSYNETIKKYGEDAVETQEALKDLLETQKEYADISVEVDEIQESISEIGKTQAEIALENISLEYDIWTRTNKKASQAEKEAKKTEEIMTRYESKMKDVLIATEKYNEACKKFGKESIEATEAYNNMLKVQKEGFDILEELRDNEKAHIEQLENELSMIKTTSKLRYDLWSTENENATKIEKHAKEITNLSTERAVAEQELLLLEQKYNNLLKQEGIESENVRQAYDNILSKKIEILEFDNKLKDKSMELLDIEQSQLDFERSRLNTAKSYWDVTNESATEAEKSAAEVERLNREMLISMKELNILSERYNKQIERYGEASDEARSAWEEYKNKQIEIIKLQNERKNLELEIIENELDMLNLAESRSKTEYEIWEALNQDADESAKQTRALTYQMKTLEFATEKLRNASKKYNYSLKIYGEDAKQTQELFNDMLDAQLDYVNTYNELKTAQKEILEKNNEILEQLDYSEKLLSYGYNMWEKLYDDVSDAQKIEAEIKKLNQSLTLQVQRANYYGVEWKKAVAKYGENSSEAQQAYLEYLEALYDALDIQSSIGSKEEQLTEWRAENARKLQEAWDEVNAKDLVGGTSIYDELVAMGMTQAEIDAYVKERAGYVEEAINTEMDFTIDNMQRKAEDALREWGLTWIDGTFDAAEEVVTNVSDCMEEMTSIIEDGAEEGNSLAEDAISQMEKIIEERGKDVVDAVDTMMDGMVDAITSNSSEVVSTFDGVVDDVVKSQIKGTNGIFGEGYTIGDYLMKGLQQGIAAGRSGVVDSMVRAVQEAIMSAQRIAQIRSPSRITIWMGEMLDTGFIKGIERHAGTIATTMARVVQNGMNAIRKVVHTDNTVEFATRMIADGITGGLEGYSYNILSIGQSVLDSLSDEYDEMVDDIVGENQWLLDALRDYGFDETTHGIEFVVNLDADEARTQLEQLFSAREDELDYYDELLNMQERNAAKDQSDLYVRAEGQAIARELDRVLRSIASYEQQLSDIVSAGRATSYEDTIAGKKTEFVQNIYSTKPLSPLDIYRNTNSLLLKFTAWR